MLVRKLWMYAAARKWPAVAAVLLALSAVVLTAGYTAMEIGVEYTDPNNADFGINAGGDIVGTGTNQSTGEYYAYAWRAGALTVLPNLGQCCTTVARDINTGGVVVGSAAVASGWGHPVYWTAANEIRELPMPAAYLSGDAYAVNDSGWIVGYVYNGGYYAARWKPDAQGNYTLANFTRLDLGFATDINASGQISGWVRWSAFEFAVWQPDGTLTRVGKPAGSEHAYAQGINDAGWVVGYAAGYVGTTYVTNAILWKGGGAFETLSSVTPGANTAATAINNRGEISGSESFNWPRAVVWQPQGNSHTAVDLGGLPLFGISSAHAINDDGSVAGWAHRQDPRTGNSVFPAVLWQSDTPPDADGDGVADSSDNCAADANADQSDVDADGIGDACDPRDDRDRDSDGVLDTADNCLDAANANQSDADRDGLGDACDADDDNDGVSDGSDAFPFDAGESVDTDGDGVGNNGDPDDDGDGQSDADETACGSNPVNAASTAPNFDGDASPDCLDPDDDNDGVADGADAFPLNAGESIDTDGDGSGDNGDPDDDGDGVLDGGDNCRLTRNASQRDTDGDGVGDACDAQIGPPTNKDQCKDGGWRLFNFPAFKNQGQCVSAVASGRTE